MRPTELINPLFLIKRKFQTRSSEALFLMAQSPAFLSVLFAIYGFQQVSTRQGCYSIDNLVIKAGVFLLIFTTGVTLSVFLLIISNLAYIIYAKNRKKFKKILFNTFIMLYMIAIALIVLSILSYFFHY